MTYIQATQGGGGWPMNVFLTPDLQPFIGGTYWPPRDAYGRPGEASGSGSGLSVSLQWTRLHIGPTATTAMHP